MKIRREKRREKERKGEEKRGKERKREEKRGKTIQAKSLGSCRFEMFNLSARIPQNVLNYPILVLRIVHTQHKVREHKRGQHRRKVFAQVSWIYRVQGVG